MNDDAYSPTGRGTFPTSCTGLSRGGGSIARELREAGLTGRLGTTNATNVHGEQVQRMDARANEFFVDAFQDSGIVRIVVSEEMDEPFVVAQAEASGKYAVFFDPLDGSSNVDVNASLGSIFSIHRLTPREIS